MAFVLKSFAEEKAYELRNNFLEQTIVELSTDEQGQPCHRRGVLLCPTGTVEQWYKLVTNHYKDLTPILCHGENPQKGESGNWVSATAMRQGPENMTHWPTKLKNVFQKDQPKASQAIFISSYDTFPGRSMTVDWRKSGKKKNDFEDCQPVYKPRYAGCFAYSILDEGHRVRHDDAEAYKCVKLTKCPVNWFLTATPVVNHPDVRSCSSDRCKAHTNRVAGCEGHSPDSRALGPSKLTQK